MTSDTDSLKNTLSFPRRCCYCTGMLHNKLLRLHGGYTEHASSGFVINLIATDVQRFDIASTAVHFGWMAVVDLVVIGIIVCYQVGYEAGLAGIAVIMCSMGISMAFSKQIFRLRELITGFTSSRTNVITEVLRSMLSVKAFGWERPFTDKVRAPRARDPSFSLRLAADPVVPSCPLHIRAPVYLQCLCTHETEKNKKEFRTALRSHNDGPHTS